MTLKEYTESLISSFLARGGEVNPDITLDIFKMIEGDKDLYDEYQTVCDNSNHGRDSVNPYIGKNIRAHFDLVNDKTISASGKCNLITNYKRFHPSETSSAKKMWGKERNTDNEPKTILDSYMQIRPFQC